MGVTSVRVDSPLPRLPIRGVRRTPRHGRAPASRGTIHIVLPARSRQLATLRGRTRTGMAGWWVKVNDDRELIGLKVLLLTGTIILTAALERVM